MPQRPIPLSFSGLNILARASFFTNPSNFAISARFRGDASTSARNLPVSFGSSQEPLCKTPYALWKNELGEQGLPPDSFDGMNTITAVAKARAGSPLETITG